MSCESQWWVVCLCAGWCGVCREYQPLFDALAVQHPGIRFQWVDVEDDSDVVGDLDIETFPTLLIANEAGARFFSPLAPHIGVLVLGQIINQLGVLFWGVQLSPFIKRNSC